MSGHSHFKTIQHRKTTEDQKRGKVFSKLSRMISVAAKDGGDPETNSKLRQALEEAREFNLPKENIERAIKRGTGELEGEKLETVTYEAFWPYGIALIIDGITDNKNRTLSEVKQILQKHNGKLADEGSVKWLFEKRGVIVINLAVQGGATKETLELRAIEAEAEDTYWHEEADGEFLDVYTRPEELDKVKKDLEGQGTRIESATLDWVAKEQVEISEKEKTICQKLFEELGENDAVQDIYSNIRT